MGAGLEAAAKLLRWRQRQQQLPSPRWPQQQPPTARPRLLSRRCVWLICMICSGSQQAVQPLYLQGQSTAEQDKMKDRMKRFGLPQTKDKEQVQPTSCWQMLPHLAGSHAASCRPRRRGPQRRLHRASQAPSRLPRPLHQPCLSLQKRPPNARPEQSALPRPQQRPQQQGQLRQLQPPQARPWTRPQPGRQGLARARCQARPQQHPQLGVQSHEVQLRSDWGPSSAPAEVHVAYCISMCISICCGPF